MEILFHGKIWCWEALKNLDEVYSKALNKGEEGWFPFAGLDGVCSNSGGWRSPSKQPFAFPARTMEAAAPLGSASTRALALGTAPAPGTALGMASPAGAKCIR